MTSISAQVEIQCPIGLFEQQEAKIEALTQAINAGRTPAAKAPNARTLIDEVNVLLDCRSYDRGNQNCRLCRSFSALRRKAASLIVKSGAAGASR